MTKPDRNLPSYVYQTHKRYYVSQTVDNERIIYGRYDTREEAIQRRNQLVREGTIKPRQGLHRIKEYADRHICEKCGRFYISKSVCGRVEHFGVFKSLEDAREERDYLESIDWDYGNMD